MALCWTYLGVGRINGRRSCILPDHLQVDFLGDSNEQVPTQDNTVVEVLASQRPP